MPADTQRLLRGLAMTDEERAELHKQVEGLKVQGKRSQVALALYDSPSSTVTRAVKSVVRAATGKKK